MAPALIAALAPTLIKGVGAWKQGQEANQIAAGNRRSILDLPTYNIPPSVAQYVAGVRAQALDPRLAGQAVLENKIDAATNSAIDRMIQSGGSSSDVLNTAAQAQGNEVDSLLNLGVTSAQDYRTRQRDASQALLTDAEYKDKKFAQDQNEYLKEFSYNKDEPYKEAAAAASALKNASAQNLFGAAEDLGTVGVLAGMNPDMFKMGSGAGGGSGISGVPLNPTQVPSKDAVNTYTPPAGPDWSNPYGSPTPMQSLPTYNASGIPYAPTTSAMAPYASPLGSPPPTAPSPAVGNMNQYNMGYSKDLPPWLLPYLRGNNAYNPIAGPRY